MRATLIINGKDLGNYIEEDGLDFQYTTRKEKTVVTMDGKKLYRGIDRLKINVALLDMPDSYYQDLIAYIKMRDPATVTYSDLETGVNKTGKFYVGGLTHKARRVIGDTTYLTGLSFELEER